MPTIKSIAASIANYTRGRQGNRVRYIVVHYTATNASAKNNGIYFSRPGANASAHYFVDGSGTIIKSVRECDTAWCAGDWWMNLRSINIEVVSAGQDFTEAQLRELEWLVQSCMRRYHIPASRVIRHYDVTGKLCPKPYINNKKWTTLRKRITSLVKPKPKPAGPKCNVAYALGTMKAIWLPWVQNYNNTNNNGFAGIPGCAHRAFKAKATRGTLRYRIHKKGDPRNTWSKWYKNGRTARVFGAIDGIWPEYIPENGKPEQHVHIRCMTSDSDDYLDWCVDNHKNVYDRWCGILGKPIACVQMYIE